MSASARTRNLPHVVYIHRGQDGSVLYIGCSSNLAGRTRSHLGERAYAAQVAGVERESVHPDWESGHARELDLIALHQPIRNLDGNPTFAGPWHEWREAHIRHANWWENVREQWAARLAEQEQAVSA